MKMMRSLVSTTEIADADDCDPVQRLASTKIAIHEAATEVKELIRTDKSELEESQRGFESHFHSGLRGRMELALQVVARSSQNNFSKLAANNCNRRGIRIGFPIFHSHSSGRPWFDT